MQAEDKHLRSEIARLIGENKELILQLNRLRYELAKHEGAEMMRGGREDMMKEAAK
jgi:regulator of replication initiation timing